MRGEEGEKAFVGVSLVGDVRAAQLAARKISRLIQLVLGSTYTIVALLPIEWKKASTWR
jgi:hypothetical protein